MVYRVLLAIVLLQATSGIPLSIGKRGSRFHHALEKTARDAEKISKAAIKFFFPGTIKMGIAGMKPIIRKRQVSKRQAIFNPVATSYYQGQYPTPYLNSYNTHFNYPRSYINQPQNALPAQQNDYYRNALMSMYMFNPAYMQARRNYIPAPINNNNIPVKKSNIDPMEQQAAMESLSNFRKIVAEVKDAIVSIDSNGKIALNENFNGGSSTGLAKNGEALKKSGTSNKDAVSGKKREEIKKKDRENKKNVIKDQIAKYFTDFVCGDYC